MFLAITENTVCEEDTWLTVEEIQKCKHYIKTVQSTQRRLHRKGRWYGKIFLCSWVELGDICYSVLCPSQHVNIALSCLAGGHRTPGHSGGFPRMLSQAHLACASHVRDDKPFSVHLVWHLISSYYLLSLFTISIHLYIQQTSVQTAR